MNDLTKGILIWVFIGIMGTYLTKDMPEVPYNEWEETQSCWRC